MTEEYVANATREFDSERNIRELHQVRIEDTAEKAHWPGSIAPRTAFAILRSASQNGNVKLRDIAGAVVTSVTGEPPRPAPPFEEGRSG